MLAITDKQSCSPACSDSHHYPGKSIMRRGGKMDPFGSHIQSMAASSLAAECTAHVRPWPAFKPAVTGAGATQHCLTSAPRCCNNVDHQQKTEAETPIKTGLINGAHTRGGSHVSHSWCECGFNGINDVKPSRMSNRRVLLNATSGINNHVAPWQSQRD